MRVAVSVSRAWMVSRHWSLSASLTMTTRASVMAMRSARSFRRSSRVNDLPLERWSWDTRESLDTPVTMVTMESGVVCLSSRSVTGVSSNTSWSSAAATTLLSIPSSATMRAVATWAERTVSPLLRSWPRCAAAATLNALTTAGDEKARCLCCACSRVDSSSAVSASNRPESSPLCPAALECSGGFSGESEGV